jgi:anthranilate phosphoribosyltransferase
MDIQQALIHLMRGQSLDPAQMRAVMRQIMTGGATNAQIAGFLVAMNLKGETVGELTAAAEVMRELATNVTCASQSLVDTCGTGGDGAKIFNVSTASAFVVAAAGGSVAKHGNRSVSSSSGSSDVLEAAGVKLDIPSDHVVRCIDHLGVGFLFAPAHHGAMKHAASVRRELGLRTMFNLLGPLVNPASVPYQVMGVFEQVWVRPIAEVLKQLGSKRVMVVHSLDGLDEFSIAGPTAVCELRDGKITEYEVVPEDVGLERQSLDSCVVGSAQESLALIKAVFANEAGSARDMVLLNAGAALTVTGLARDLAAGVDMAADAVASGLAREKFKALVDFTNLPYTEQQ